MEIGGDFWKEEIEYRNDKNKSFFEFGEDNHFVLSGRTAIDVAIQDILKSRKIKNVYFPSYSCESMIQPFKDRGIKIDFYDVYFDNTLQYNIDIDFECDIFFAMNYFGYTCTNMEEYITVFKQKNSVIIEDFTQSLLSSKAYSNYSDYLICSLRKWFPINCGGIVSKTNGKFNISFENFEINYDVVENKNEAMKQKLDCICNNSVDEHKNEFLALYKKSNFSIKDNYINKLMDNESIYYILNIDLDEIKNKRKKNVKIIYENLDLNNYKLLINNYNEEKDCLLYVPIYVQKEKLKILKEKIYADKFYCPSHWPLDVNINDLYERELSIVCDQRYTSKMIREKIKLL